MANQDTEQTSTVAGVSYATNAGNVTIPDNYVTSYSSAENDESREQLLQKIKLLRNRILLFAEATAAMPNETTDPEIGSKWDLLSSTSGHEQFNKLMKAVDNRITERQEEFESAFEQNQKAFEKKVNKRLKAIEQRLQTNLLSPKISTKQVQQVSDPDLQWILAHEEEVRRYEGKYIAVSNGRIVGAGATSEEALRQAEEVDPDSDPLIHLVPARGLSI